ncbi:YbaB/EbfC family DNA-binding protein [Mycolicibacterium sp. XJ1819]
MVGDAYPTGFEGERDDLVAALDFSAPGVAADDDEPSEPVYTVTNPPGTVSVTAFMDGRLKQIELSPKVAEMTERDLADEIVVIAALATQDAKSAQYAFMLEGMRQQGHDDVATRDFLRRDLDLPTPEEAQAARAHIFATRYESDHD